MILYSLSFNPMKMTMRRRRPDVFGLAACLVQTAFCLVQTALCLVQTALCLVQTALCLVQTAFCLVQTALCLVQTALCLVQTALCLVQTAYWCALNRVFRFILTTITAHFKIVLFILRVRIIPPCGRR